MKISPELAEICGIHAGDGYLRNANHKWELDISGGMDEKVYYDNHVKSLFKSVFNVDLDTKGFQSRFTYGFVLRDKGIIEFMHSLGFPYGKKTYVVRVPAFIRNSGDKCLKLAFLRGFFDTDGCISFDKGYGKYIEFKRTHHVFPRVILSTVSKPLFEDLDKLIRLLGFQFAVQIYQPKLANEHISYRIWLRSSNAVKWMDTIKSGNPSKTSRYEIWKKYSFCPPRTTYEQRKEILNNTLDPNSFYKGP